MKNSNIISQLLCLYNLVQFTVSNHLKVRHICEDQHIDITKASGVAIEANASSIVKLTGLKFPLNSFTEGDKLSVQFRTSSNHGLIFHAQSHHLKHELTAWIENGEVRVRLTGNCHWLYLRDIAHDSYNVSDNNFHTLIIMVKSAGISFTIDHRDEQMFFYSRSPIFHCWHIEQYFFGLPNPETVPSEAQGEFNYKMDACLRYFTSQRTNNTDTTEMVTSYKRVSSCEGLS